MKAGLRRRLRKSGLTEIAKTAQADGWDVDWTRSGHLKFVHTSGALVYASGTSSDYRSAQNLLSDLRRVERQQTLDETRR